MNLTDIIPENLTDVNLPPAPQENKSPQLSRFAERFFCFLLGDYHMRLRNKQIPPGGYFWSANKRFTSAMGVSRWTIIRAKKELAEANLIRFRTHQGRGKATEYWIVDQANVNATKKPVRPDKISSQLAQKIADCARQFSKDYALQYFMEQGLDRADIELVLGLC